MVGGNWLKSIFFLFLDHLPGFPNYTFLNFQKKFFSLHPNVQYLSQYSPFSEELLLLKVDDMHSSAKSTIKQVIQINLQQIFDRPAVIEVFFIKSVIQPVACFNKKLEQERGHASERPCSKRTDHRSPNLRLQQKTVLTKFWNEFFHLFRSE